MKDNVQSAGKTFVNMQGSSLRIYQRPLSNLSTVDIMLHRQLLNYLRLYYLKHRSSFKFHPLVHSILNEVPALCFIPCFFLAYLNCRYNELKQIDIGLIKSRTSYHIKSSKSKHERTVAPLHVFNPDQLRAINTKTLVNVISYDHLKLMIKRSRPPDLKLKLKGKLNCTHIFRHLNATFLADQGFCLSDISNILGHENTATTKTYIHEGV